MKKDFSKAFRAVWLLLVIVISLGAMAQTPQEWKSLKRTVNFFMANDLGRNGYYDQRTIADLMGNMAEVIGPECVIAAGDVHHFDGVASVNDPLWMTNYECIYAHPELMIAWHPILGNHEYRGSTQAVLDYGKVSRRWEMLGRYYTKTYEDNGVSVRLVFIDTTPLIDKYRKDSEKYPDACGQDIEEQLAWLDTTLKNAVEDWVIVIGHHPIYAETPKSKNERLDMQRRVDNILRRNRVDIYAAGHIHNFQHIRVDGSPIDYVVNSSASLSRKVNSISGTRFCDSNSGFSIIAVDKAELNMHFLDKTGKVLYSLSRRK